MTELQVSLIAIGSSIVVGVISYNKWQEYKARKSVERAFSSSSEDVLMRDTVPVAERREPRFDGADVPDDAQEPEPGPEEAHLQSVQQPEVVGVAEVPAAAGERTVSSRPAHKVLPVDELIDCEIAIELEGPVRGEKVLPAIQRLRHVGGKAVHYIGQTEDGQWETVATGGVYSTLRAGVQIANRSSSLNEIEFSEIVARLREVADEIGGEPFVPDMARVMTAARELHHFVAEHDAQLGVNVQSRGAPWAVSTLLAALERHGFDQRPDGRLVMQDGDNGVLFSLSTNVTNAEDSTSRLTLLLDVPRVAADRDGFGSMVACARMLAARLDGVVVDDAGQPLADADLAAIATQVDSFYADMESVGIAAGSVRALRLFS